ncbi:hypothetical protein HMPREF3100_06225 [Enterococcus sp. HMSC29A04]|nr:hypothetical protein HMPREF3001_13950 [Enterococcus sp. HMSC066C04]OFT88104.1 hypothetical protein HMPREF3100_06225 [Enterococcus sp. HMSC29A04]OFU59598.1 hypothetical protein HMPREF3128_18770 [Enterococcus sp. HMSC14A10]OJG87089.1 hypothetical protein RV13_GL003890 [Enterococcus raffinosus]
MGVAKSIGMKACNVNKMNTYRKSKHFFQSFVKMNLTVVLNQEESLIIINYIFFFERNYFNNEM